MRLVLQRIIAVLLLGVSGFAIAQESESQPAPATGTAAPEAGPGQVQGSPLSALKTEAERAAEKASETVDVLKSGKLISSGLTGGLGFAVQVPARRVDGAKLLASKAVAMPYLMVLPFYFGAPEATRHYCASHWAGGNENTAQRAAMAIAEQRAELLFDSIVSAIRAGQQNDAAIATQLLGDKTVVVKRDGQCMSVRVGEDLVTSIRSWVSARTGSAEAQARQRAHLVAWLAAQDWNPSLPGDCLSKKLGLWVGKPLSHKAKSTVRDTGEAVREFSPIVAFGAGFSPNANFSLLIGLTVGSLADVRDANTSVDVTSLTGTLAIGGNLDLLGSLFK